MKGDVKAYREKGRHHDTRQRCGKLTLTAMNELDAALLAMLARVLFYPEGTKGFTRGDLYETLVCEMVDFDDPRFKDLVTTTVYEVLAKSGEQEKEPPHDGR